MLITIFVVVVLLGIFVGVPIAIVQMLGQSVTAKNVSNVQLIDGSKNKRTFKVTYKNGKTKIETVSMGDLRYKKLINLVDPYEVREGIYESK